MSWEIAQDLNEKRTAERGSQKFLKGLFRPIAFVYPNHYHIGMSNLGLHILYQIINARGDCACERYFLPESNLLCEHQKSKTPLLSVESGRQLADNEIIFVMLSFEMDYDNLLTILDLANIKLRAKERNKKEPLIIIGGPCATFNPLPLSSVADAFVIGEGEEVVPKILDICSKDKDETLHNLSKIAGIYVPTLNKKVQRQWVKKIDNYPHTSAIITEKTEFSNMYIVEVARGCGRHCRFCMAGYCFRKPRPRALANILEDIKNRPEGTEKIGLMGAAVSDHPDIDKIVDFLTENKIKFSFASLRADNLNEKMCNGLAKSGQKTLTIAPEAGSERLRKAINKGITEKHIFNAINLAAKSGMQNIKLYFMIGLPNEKDEDVEAILDMVRKVRQDMDAKNYKGDLVLSVNAFVPKPFTPYQWQGLTKVKVLRHRLKILSDGLRNEKKIKLITESLKATVVQAILAKGDEKIGELLLQAHKSGQNLKLFMQKNGLNIEKIAEKTLMAEEKLPWDFIDVGVKKEYLLNELKKSKQGEETLPCFDNCQRCGVCEK